MIVHTSVTYADGDLNLGLYAGHRFEQCTFLGTARDCNFIESIFVGCTFDPAFAFERCSLYGAIGLPERFDVPPVPEFPTWLGYSE